ncbi:MAG: MotA/TolQ/ExbB proton channel family protein [bacterium]|nr:MotA/TolQ/ExbB proton channel family protein [bacterium]
MQVLFDGYTAIRDFMELGGPVLNAIAVTILLMWILIVERVIYFRSEHGRRVAAEQRAWAEQQEHRSWYARQIKTGIVSRLTRSAHGPIPMIKTLVALCPLLGLVGTVTGMIEVFDVLALSGTGNARSMAAGVSKATIPTMAGMVGALSGVFAAALLTRAAGRAVKGLDEIFINDGRSD